MGERWVEIRWFSNHKFFEFLDEIYGVLTPGVQNIINVNILNVFCRLNVHKSQKKELSEFEDLDT